MRVHVNLQLYKNTEENWYYHKKKTLLKLPKIVIPEEITFIVQHVQEKHYFTI